MPRCETLACLACYPSGNFQITTWLVYIYTESEYYLMCFRNRCTAKAADSSALASFTIALSLLIFHHPRRWMVFCSIWTRTKSHRSSHLTPPTWQFVFNETHNCELGGCKKFRNVVELGTKLIHCELGRYNHSAAPLPSFWSPKMRWRKSSTILGSPSCKATLGAHPSNSFALEMSGFLMCGSSAVLARCSIFAFGSTTFFTTCTGWTSPRMKQSWMNRLFTHLWPLCSHTKGIQCFKDSNQHY